MGSLSESVQSRPESVESGVGLLCPDTHCSCLTGMVVEDVTLAHATIAATATAHTG